MKLQVIHIPKEEGPILLLIANPVHQLFIMIIPAAIREALIQAEAGDPHLAAVLPIVLQEQVLNLPIQDHQHLQVVVIPAILRENHQEDPQVPLTVVVQAALTVPVVVAAIPLLQAVLLQVIAQEAEDHLPVHPVLTAVAVVEEGIRNRR